MAPLLLPPGFLESTHAKSHRYRSLIFSMTRILHWMLHDQLLKAAVNGRSLFIAELLDEGANVEYKDMVCHA
jgi:hypothetical protein